METIFSGFFGMEWLEQCGVRLDNNDHHFEEKTKQPAQIVIYMLSWTKGHLNYNFAIYSPLVFK